MCGGAVPAASVLPCVGRCGLGCLTYAAHDCSHDSTWSRAGVSVVARGGLWVSVELEHRSMAGMR